MSTVLDTVSRIDRIWNRWEFAAPVQTPTLPFRDFITQVNPHYQFYPYLNQIIDTLQRVADGELGRVMIFMPPRHGKSELASRLFAAYYLSQNPEEWVGLVSAGANLAYTLSRNARDNYTRLGGILREDASAVKHWQSPKGGGLWAAGIGGQIYGKGFNLGIIDDPIKDAQEAMSPTIQARNRDWFDSVFWTRRDTSSSAVILVTTRWGQKDLAGYILDRERESPEYWHIVHLEAIREDKPSYPETCTIAPDPREIGEPLDRFPLSEFEKAKEKSKWVWASVYQQNPRPRTGLVYHGFPGPGPHSQTLPLDQAEGFYHSHDFGAVNHTFGLWAKIKGVYYLVYEEKLPEGTTTRRAQRILSHLEGRKVVAGWGGAKSEKQQRRDFIKAGLDMRPPPIADVDTQVNQANEMLEAGEMVICSDMTQTIDQLMNCVFDANENIADKSIWHFVDMVRYFAIGIKYGGWAR